MKENDLPGITNEVIEIKLSEPWFVKHDFFFSDDELEDLRRRYSDEDLLKLWEEVIPKISEEMRKNFNERFDQMIVFGTETYKYKKDELDTQK
jgi:hypothetical protein